MFSRCFVQRDYLRFPSPFGVSLFQIRIPSQGTKRWTIISVPFRGLVISNKYQVDESFTRVLFPSPFGVSLFQIQYRNCCTSSCWISVPFRGLVISNWFVGGHWNGFRRFPSPFGVSLFQIVKDSFARNKDMEYFRPLSGSRYFKSWGSHLASPHT